MKRLASGPSCLCFAVILLTLLCAATNAQQEVPSHYPGAWYRIILDGNGDLIGGDGDGFGSGTWYYYPETGWYRQWYYNQPYDPDRQGFLRYDTYIKAIDPNKYSSVEIRMTWATPEWSALGLGHPPLPQDAPNAGSESVYMDGVHMFALQDVFIGGSTEPIKEYYIEDYNPEWVAIDFRGSNIYVYRGAKHECLGDLGACCLESTGECFLSYEEDCSWPYVWLGAGTSCAACGENDELTDYGDAPDTYRTKLISDGARHTVTAGVYLGIRIDGEADGLPSSSATADNSSGINDEDGITFETNLTPGQPATIEAVASVDGYLSAWIDFNRNGTFGDPGDQILADASLSAGSNHLAFDVPATAPAGQVFARFRFSTRGLLDYYGPASDGEVEDYKITIDQTFTPQINSGKGGLKWAQPPQAVEAEAPYIFDGWDAPSSLYLNQIVADDWRSNNTQPVTGLQWWGSYSGWTESAMPTEQPVAFHIAIWTDAPKVADASLSDRPDMMVWETYCTNWTWNVAGREQDPRNLVDDETCFQFTALLSQNEWFYPEAETTYWLSISAVYDIQSTTPKRSWGWATRPTVSYAGATVIKRTSPSWPPSIGSSWLSGSPIMADALTPYDAAFEVLTNQGSGTSNLTLAPVYRFWSESLMGHFYTIDEAERDYVLTQLSDAWTYEGIAFYAYAPGTQPVGAKPVYRFWSDTLAHHFYTIDETEKDALQKNSKAWAYEGIAWYAFD